MNEADKAQMAINPRWEHVTEGNIQQGDFLWNVAEQRFIPCSIDIVDRPVSDFVCIARRKETNPVQEAPRLKSFREKLASLPPERQDKIMAEADKLLTTLNLDAVMPVHDAIERAEFESILTAAFHQARDESAFLELVETAVTRYMTAHKDSYALSAQISMLEEEVEELRRINDDYNYVSKSAGRIAEGPKVVMMHREGYEQFVADRHEMHVLKHQLGNILARVHRDGGHYIDEHGWEKALADADLILADLIVKPETNAPAAVNESGLTVPKDKFEYKEEWTHRADTFSVVISRHSVERCDAHEESADGLNRWSIYAYIYLKHPLFEHLNGEKLSWHSSVKMLPLHEGLSFHRIHYAENNVACSVQIGCDYNHIRDAHYTMINTVDAFIDDANKLIEALNDINERGEI